MNNEDKKISKNREKKEVLVGELSDKVNKATNIVFANYQGMTHQQIEQLKKGLKKVGAEMLVIKNTLMIRALQSKVADESVKKELQGPTATLFAFEDPIAPLKELAKVIKNLKLPHVKFGIFEGKLISEPEITKLSTLPAKEILIAQVLGRLNGPIAGFVSVLNANMVKLVMTLKAIEQKK